ncbi:fibronectin type III domain-containing protein [Desulfoferrobacter suflitae]|uniref:fibronectin type III domain-containing protein n=1 Tax=Desulfoferrobacter suflitae TaxID=2865782 RepID=UPI002164E9E8|nr:hypothetical protein [Desulfoferrobacter suflitae]MCK8601305.1 hypothetical protein [Desulfoferrobacter suflitae]
MHVTTRLTIPCNVFVAFTIVCAAALLVSGCGKKSAPRPILPAAPPEIKNLEARVRATGVELSWSLSHLDMESDDDHAYGLAVLRAQVPWDKRNCLECPVMAQEVLQRLELPRTDAAAAQDHKMTLIDAQVMSEHAYRYQIAFQDDKGRVLSLSNPIIAKVLPPPQPPLDFKANEQDQGIQLHWKIPRKNVEQQTIAQELQFDVQRRSQEGAWESISPAPVKGSTFFDSAVASNQLYDYRAFSVLSFEGTAILSEPSPVRRAKAPGALPAPPPGAVWVIPAKGALEVNWTPSDGQVKGYHVYRREGKDIVRLTADPVENPPYVDHAVQPNRVYFYAVSAVGIEPPNQEGLLSKWQEIRNVQFQ